MRVSHIRGGIYVAFHLDISTSLKAIKYQTEALGEPVSLPKETAEDLLDVMAAHGPNAIYDFQEHVASYINQNCGRPSCKPMEETSPLYDQTQDIATQYTCLWHDLDAYAGGMVSLARKMESTSYGELFDITHLAVVQSALGDYYIRASGKTVRGLSDRESNQRYSYILLDEIDSKFHAGELVLALAGWLSERGKTVTYTRTPIKSDAE